MPIFENVNGSILAATRTTRHESRWLILVDTGNQLVIEEYDTHSQMFIGHTPVYFRSMVQAMEEYCILIQHRVECCGM